MPHLPGSPIFFQRQRRWIQRVLRALDCEELAATWPTRDEGKLRHVLDRLEEARRDIARQLPATWRKVRRQLFFLCLQMGCRAAAEVLRLDFMGDLAGADAPPPGPLADFVWPVTRPPRHKEFNQLACTPNTSLRRAWHLHRELTGLGKRVLLLGDDDGVSLPLSTLPEMEVHVLDIDEDLLHWLALHGPAVQVHRVDLDEGLDPKLLQSFAAVMLDPHWDLPRLAPFLSQAQLCLEPRPESRLFLHHNPLLAGPDYPRLGRIAYRYGLGTHRLIPHASWYDLAGLMGEHMSQAVLLAETHRQELAHPLLLALSRQPYLSSYLHVLRLDRPDEPGSLRRRLRRWWHSS